MSLQYDQVSTVNNRISILLCCKLQKDDLNQNSESNSSIYYLLSIDHYHATHWCVALFVEFMCTAFNLKQGTQSNQAFSEAREYD